MNSNPPKKLLKISKPFEPTSQQQQPSSQPYYPQPNYYPQTYPNYHPNEKNPYSYNPQQPIFEPNIQPNIQSNTYSNIPTKPITNDTQQPQLKKEKKKLVLTQSNIQIDQDLVKKVEEEQKRKQEEEQKRKQEEEELQKQLDALKPKQYTQEQLLQMIEKITEFPIYFTLNEWPILKERKHFGVKELKKDVRKDGKTNTNKYTDYNKQQNGRVSVKQQQQQQQQQPLQFEKGVNVQQITSQSENKDVKKTIIIERVVEDIATKQLKDKMKEQAEAFTQSLNQQQDVYQIVEKDLRYRLNQLAPDNKESVFKLIVQILIDHKGDPQTKEQNYYAYLAKQIIEKSQVEPKYRKLYCQLCKRLTEENQLCIDKVDNKGKKKRHSYFKSELLNQVQNVFQGRSKNNTKEIANLSAEERELHHLIRKNKIMGNVRFIGDLYSESLLPFMAVSHAISELLIEYLVKYDKDNENSEESIEGLIELVDQIGGKYKTPPNQQNNEHFDIQKLEELLNGKARTAVEIQQCFQLIEKQLTLDGVFRIFELLKKEYKLSQRLQILIENILDRKNQGWKDTHNKQGDQAQTVKAVHQEQEKEQFEQQYSKQKKYQSNNKQQSSSGDIYVEKYPDQQQQQQQQEPQFDLNEISMFVTGSFNMDPLSQSDKLREELKRISTSQDAIEKFFDTFFEQLLKCKNVKKNLERAQLVSELLFMKEAPEQIVQNSVEKTLTEDLVYDLAESPTSRELIIDIISYFIVEQDFNCLKKLHLKPKVEIEDFIDLMGKVAGQLLSKFPEESKQKFINDYFSDLGYSL